ncbi:MAG: diaminopimelate decarboxylase [Endomicrobia bacterium]|nr:diaminopimelate decarboxylase [Endomicrobiia bacterium]
MINLVTPKLNYKNGLLHFEEVNLGSLVTTYSTPLYVYSRNQIVENFLEYKKALNKRKHLICFAVKANTNYQVLRIICSLGGGADVTSGGELYRVIKAGISPKKIVYAGVGKTKEEIMFALKNGIFLFNIESKDEAILINTLAKSFRKKVDVAIRVNPEVSTGAHYHISTGEEGTKFGIPIDELIEFARYILYECKNLNLVGLHYHIGSQICLLKPFVDAAKKVVKEIHKLSQIGVKIKYIDIGGGLGIRYKNERPPTPQSLILRLFEIIPEELTIICEPGRYIVGNAGVLITKVLYHKKVKNKNFLIVDASMTDLIRPAFYGAYHNIVPLSVNREQLTMNYYDVVGPVCETSDFLGKNRYLPDIPNGEYLVIETVGAYGFVMSSNYNSRCRAAEIMVNGKQHYLIREREDYKDITKNEYKC